MSIWQDRYAPSYQDGVGIRANAQLHRSSYEITAVLNHAGLLTPGVKIFEIGAGGGRNLTYINDACPSAVLLLNDLHRSASFANMHESIVEKVTFMEIDTRSLFREHTITDIDVLLCCDHLMHLDRDTADEVLRAIETRWRPRFAVFRECKPFMEDRERYYPRLYHDVTLSGFTNTWLSTSRADERYTISVWKRNDITE